MKLSSGTWNWKLRPQADGSMVTFSHAHRLRDEMRTWTPYAELTEDRAVQLAWDPVERYWLDPDGFLWEIHTELPSDWGNANVPVEKRAVRLVFTCGSTRRTVAVAADSHLGEFRHSELSRIFKLA